MKLAPFRSSSPRSTQGAARLVGVLLIVAVLVGGGALYLWKRSSFEAAAAAAAQQPEPMEVVQAVTPRSLNYQRTSTAIGTVRALRSITLRNELPGRVVRSALVPGAIVEAGTELVSLDVAVEEAEWKAQEARTALAETILQRLQRALESRGASELDVDRARAERDVAKAEATRLAAVIERKTIRAPFRARVGLADVHPGQYLDAGTELSTLQGVDDGAHVDFSVAQAVAQALTIGASVEIYGSDATNPLPAKIAAIDARVDPRTRNAMVRARIDGPAPAPGSAVRVRVPVGTAQSVLAVPVSALRRGPSGDHVFVLAADATGKTRAHLRVVISGPAIGDDVVIESGLTASESIAASGSFKLREGVQVLVAPAAR